eukprot:TRINITY_DN11622_c0_g1_i3.p1 TRINITY_DN11622_c0_g1~~TRINITY_DN11622_c0_g1_i3.p1  ORF type:complete len:247 (+),score=32.43 TRINITY_DN11622_c0_g1_i3:243-983(+)
MALEAAITPMFAGLHAAPHYFGVSEWMNSYKPGVPRSEEDTSEDWESILQPGDSCYLRPGQAGSVLDCPCSEASIKITLDVPADTATYAEGCTVVTWPESTAVIADSADNGFAKVPCLYIPAGGGLQAELAILTTKEREAERCAYGVYRFSSMGHYFLIYLPLCLVLCWCSLISCACCCELKLGPQAQLIPQPMAACTYGKKAGTDNITLAVEAAKWSQPVELSAPIYVPRQAMDEADVTVKVAEV